MIAKALVWLRNDLRLADNPALHAAFKLGGAITALFVHEVNPQLRDPGAAVRWWLEQSLDLLARSLNERNIELIVADGEALNTIEQLIEENNFDTVFWNRRYAPQSAKSMQSSNPAKRTKDCAWSLLQAICWWNPGRSNPATADLIKFLHHMPNHCASMV